MTPNATIDDLRSTPIEEIVPSPRARSALKTRDVATLGDAIDMGFDALGEIPGVGAGSLDRIRAAARPLPPEPPPPPTEIVEEGTHPILCECVYPSFAMQLAPAHLIRGPGDIPQEQDPHYLEFDDHRAELTKRAWLYRSLKRDELAVDKAMSDEAYPWRVEASKWLESRKPFQDGRCRILPD